MDKITPEMFNLAMMYVQATGDRIKKIKVSSEFAYYLKEACPSIDLNTDMPEREGIRATFTGIPIVVDDEIEAEYYEIEYTKENE